MWGPCSSLPTCSHHSRIKMNKKTGMKSPHLSKRTRAVQPRAAPRRCRRPTPGRAISRQPPCASSAAAPATCSQHHASRPQRRTGPRAVGNGLLGYHPDEGRRTRSRSCSGDAEESGATSTPPICLRETGSTPPNLVRSQLKLFVWCLQIRWQLCDPWESSKTGTQGDRFSVSPLVPNLSDLLSTWALATTLLCPCASSV